MAHYSPAQLATILAQRLTTNGQGQISAETVRLTLGDFIDSLAALDLSNLDTANVPNAIAAALLQTAFNALPVEGAAVGTDFIALQGSSNKKVSIANALAAGIPDNGVPNPKLADMAAKTFKRGPASGTGDPVDDTIGTVVADLVIAGLLRSDQSKQITVGYTVQPNNLGTVASGTIALNGALGNKQFVTNNGPFTIAAPAADTDIDLLVTNGASAGSITFSGFTVGSNTGSPLTTTNGQRFWISVRRINGISAYSILALQ